MKLIAQMVARNEADRYLDEVLDHLKRVVDLIVFTDDASDDATPEIAHKHGALVYRNETPMFETNEGQLRQGAWNNLAKHAEIGDWILAIDCDEKLWASSPDVSLRKLMTNNYYDVISIKFFHMWNQTQFRADGGWAPVESSRLFRYFYGGQFMDRALACGSEPAYVNTLIQRGKFMRDSGLVMQHLGYMRDEDKLAKHERYMKLDAGKFHNINHLNSIIDPNPTLVEWSHGR